MASAVVISGASCLRTRLQPVGPYDLRRAGGHGDEVAIVPHPQGAMVDAPRLAQERTFQGEARRIYHGPLRVGHDGDFISMPAGSTQIIRSNRLQPRP